MLDKCIQISSSRGSKRSTKMRICTPLGPVQARQISVLELLSKESSILRFFFLFLFRGTLVVNYKRAPTYVVSIANDRFWSFPVFLDLEVLVLPTERSSRGRSEEYTILHSPSYFRIIFIAGHPTSLV